MVILPRRPIHHLVADSARVALPLPISAQPKNHNSARWVAETTLPAITRAPNREILRYPFSTIA
jgi:hypothetical protein